MAVADLKMVYGLVSDADLYLSKLITSASSDVGADFQSVRKLWRMHKHMESLAPESPKKHAKKPEISTPAII